MFETTADASAATDDETTSSRPLIDDRYYLRRMKEILDAPPRSACPPSYHVQLSDHVYLGNIQNATDLDLLRATGITHVLSCVATRRTVETGGESPYAEDESGVRGFLLIPAEDREDFDIQRFFDVAILFLDKVKSVNGKALVHCNMGVNRSAAVVAAYLMVDLNSTLLNVVAYIKTKRLVILSNKGFRRQLVQFARARGFLDPVADTVTATQMFYLDENAWTPDGNNGCRLFDENNPRRSRERPLQRTVSENRSTMANGPVLRRERSSSAGRKFEKETKSDDSKKDFDSIIAKAPKAELERSYSIRKERRERSRASQERSEDKNAWPSSTSMQETVEATPETEPSLLVDDKKTFVSFLSSEDIFKDREPTSKLQDIPCRVNEQLKISLASHDKPDARKTYPRSITSWTSLDGKVTKLRSVASRDALNEIALQEKCNSRDPSRRFASTLRQFEKETSLGSRENLRDDKEPAVRQPTLRERATTVADREPSPRIVALQRMLGNSDSSKASPTSKRKSAAKGKTATGSRIENGYSSDSGNTRRNDLCQMNGLDGDPYIGEPDNDVNLRTDRTRIAGDKNTTKRRGVNSQHSNTNDLNVVDVTHRSVNIPIKIVNIPNNTDSIVNTGDKDSDDISNGINSVARCNYNVTKRSDDVIWRGDHVKRGGSGGDVIRCDDDIVERSNYVAKSGDDVTKSVDVVVVKRADDTVASRRDDADNSVRSSSDKITDKITSRSSDILSRIDSITSRINEITNRCSARIAGRGDKISGLNDKIACLSDNIAGRGDKIASYGDKIGNFNDDIIAGGSRDVTSRVDETVVDRNADSIIADRCRDDVNNRGDAILIRSDDVTVGRDVEIAVNRTRNNDNNNRDEDVTITTDNVTGPSSSRFARLENNASSSASNDRVFRYGNVISKGLTVMNGMLKKRSSVTVIFPVERENDRSSFADHLFAVKDSEARRKSPIDHSIPPWVRHPLDNPWTPPWARPSPENLSTPKWVKQPYDNSWTPPWVRQPVDDPPILLPWLSRPVDSTSTLPWVSGKQPIGEMSVREPTADLPAIRNGDYLSTTAENVLENLIVRQNLIDNLTGKQRLRPAKDGNMSWTTITTLPRIDRSRSFNNDDVDMRRRASIATFNRPRDFATTNTPIVPVMISTPIVTNIPITIFPALSPSNPIIANIPITVSPAPSPSSQSLPPVVDDENNIRRTTTSTRRRFRTRDVDAAPSFSQSCTAIDDTFEVFDEDASPSSEGVVGRFERSTQSPDGSALNFAATNSSLATAAVAAAAQSTNQSPDGAAAAVGAPRYGCLTLLGTKTRPLRATSYANLSTPPPRASPESSVAVNTAARRRSRTYTRSRTDGEIGVRARLDG